MAAEAFQLLLNLKFSKTRNKPVLLKPHFEFLSRKKQREPGYHSPANSVSCFGQAPPKKILNALFISEIIIIISHDAKETLGCI